MIIWRPTHTKLNAMLSTTGALTANDLSGLNAVLSNLLRDPRNRFTQWDGTTGGRAAALLTGIDGALAGPALSTFDATRGAAILARLYNAGVAYEALVPPPSVSSDLLVSANRLIRYAVKALDVKDTSTDYTDDLGALRSALDTLARVADDKVEYALAELARDMRDRLPSTPSEPTSAAGYLAVTELTAAIKAANRFLEYLAS
jgi:hypothetical protein